MVGALVGTYCASLVAGICLDDTNSESQCMLEMPEMLEMGSTVY